MENLQEYKDFIRKNKKRILAEEGAVVLAEHYAQLALHCKKEHDEKQAAYFTRLASSTLRLSQEIGYEKYKKIVINALNSGKIARNHVEYLWDGISPLRVTFFASLGDMRVMRLAAAAKAVGIHVQLVICHFNQQRDDMIIPDYFDKVVWINSVPGDLPIALAAIREFGSHLVHCFMQCTANHCGVWLLASCDLPIVGDAYDMVNVQYNPEIEREERWFSKNSIWEKIWYENCEGVCFRSPYKKFLQRGNFSSRKSTQMMHLPEPMIDCCKMQNRISEQIKVLIWYYEEPSRKFFSKLESLGIFRLDNILFYTIDCTGGVVQERKIDNLTICPTLPYKEWIALLSACDAYVVPDWCDILDPLKYIQSARYDHFGNRYPEALENDCFLILSENYRYCKSLYKTTNRALAIKYDEFFSCAFWKNLPQQLKALKQCPADFSRVNVTSASQKIYKFYKSILERKRHD